MPRGEFENARFVATEQKPTPTIANQSFAFLEVCAMNVKLGCLSHGTSTCAFSIAITKQDEFEESLRV